MTSHKNERARKFSPLQRHKQRNNILLLFGIGDGSFLLEEAIAEAVL
jgi:hypothetical protein